jgi:hypothetical protein
MRLITTAVATVAAATLSFAQWIPLTTGMMSNRSMASDATGLYDVSYTNGIKKKVTGGSTWDPVNNGLPNSGGSYFVQSVGAAPGWLFAGTESGIYRSNDNGASWALANGSLTANANVYANKWFTNAGVTLAIFAGTIANGGGIARTDNSGNTWNIGHSGMGSNVEVHALTLIGNTIWAATSTGLWKSTDNALSWTAHAPVNYATYGIAADGNTMAIVSTFGMRYSNDGGTVWNEATGDPSNPTEGELVEFSGDLYALVGTTGCLKSTDEGHTWAPLNDGFSPVDAQAQEEFFIDGNMLYCTALFDIYSIEGTVGVAENSAAAFSIYPNTFREGFNLTNDGTYRTCLLLDASGRVAGTRPLIAGKNWITRDGLANGAYQVVVVNAAGERSAAGTVIAE